MARISRSIGTNPGQLRANRLRTNSARWRRCVFSAGRTVSAFGLDLGSIRDTTLRAGWAQTDIAINAWTVEIWRPLKPHWTVLDHRQCTACQPPPVPPGWKLSPAERSVLNKALAKALAFRDTGKMQEARQ